MSYQLLARGYLDFITPEPNVGKGSIAGFRGATFETSWRLSKPLDFRPKIAVANILNYAPRARRRLLLDTALNGAVCRFEPVEQSYQLRRGPFRSLSVSVSSNVSRTSCRLSVLTPSIVPTIRPSERRGCYGDFPPLESVPDKGGMVLSQSSLTGVPHS